MILEDISIAMAELNEESLFTLIRQYINENPSEDKARNVIDYCQTGTKVVGECYQVGEYFVGDLIYAGELFTEVIELLKPYILREPDKYIGKILLGTVYGDLHDIGKNIFKSMCEASGFKVYDIGIDQKAETFVKKVKEIKPDIVGMSGILTIAVESMKKTVDALEKEGLREDVKVIAGGNALTEEASKYIKVDAFSVNANEGVLICRKWMLESE